jgi:hypothetical protein
MFGYSAFLLLVFKFVWFKSLHHYPTSIFDRDHGTTLDIPSRTETLHGFLCVLFVLHEEESVTVSPKLNSPALERLLYRGKLFGVGRPLPAQPLTSEF